MANNPILHNDVLGDSLPPSPYYHPVTNSNNGSAIFSPNYNNTKKNTPKASSATTKTAEDPKSNLTGNTITASKTTASQTTVYLDGTKTTVTNTIGQTVGNPDGGKLLNFNANIKDGKADGGNVSVGLIPLNVGVNKDAQLTVGVSLPVGKC